MVSPGDASALSAVTVNDVEPAANAGTAVASIVKSITKLSTIDVIRLFMTKLLLLKFLRGVFLLTVS